MILNKLLKLCQILGFPLYRMEIMTAHISKAQSGSQTSKAPFKHELILSKKTSPSSLRQGTVAVHFYRQQK